MFILVLAATISRTMVGSENNTAISMIANKTTK